MSSPERRSPRSFPLLADSRLWIVAALALAAVTIASAVSLVHGADRQRAVIRAIALATGERVASAGAARVESLGLETLGSAGDVDEIVRRYREAERCRCRPVLPVSVFAEWRPTEVRLVSAGLAPDPLVPRTVLEAIGRAVTGRPREPDRPTVRLVAAPELGEQVALAIVRFDSVGPAAVELGLAPASAILDRIFGPGARRMTAMNANDNPIAALDERSVAVDDAAGRRRWGTVDSLRPYRATIQLHGPLEGFVLSLALDHRQVMNRIGALVRPNELWHLGLLSLATLLVIVLAFRAVRREADVARARSDFVAGVSHDLRMPLAQVLLAAETLSLGRERNEGERRSLLTSIVREAKRLIGLVENVLLYSRTGAVGLAPTLTRVEVAGLLASVVEATGLAVEDAGQSLEASGETAAAVQADAGLLRQALVNLVDNAAKYGRAGGRIRLGCDANAATVRLYVEDDGPGIPDAERARLFEPYERLGRDRDSEKTGSGLGLAVVRSIALACRGRATIETGAAGGTRVVVELPAAP